MDSNISDIEYLSITDVAKYTGIPVSTLQYRCKNNYYNVRLVNSAGRRGARYEIEVASLGEDARRKLGIRSEEQSKFGVWSVGGNESAGADSFPQWSCLLPASGQ